MTVINTNDISKLLIKYKNLINFDDKMEKDNFKYINKMIVNRNYSNLDKFKILNDIIDIHNNYLNEKERIIEKFKVES